MVTKNMTTERAGPTVEMDPDIYSMSIFLSSFFNCEQITYIIFYVNLYSCF
jgi:hypothetical protein